MYTGNRPYGPSLVVFPSSVVGWLDRKSMHTHKTALILNFLINKGDMNAEQISKELGIKVFDRGSPLSEKDACMNE